jgi:cytochrome c-type biogenesis protein CcmE
MLYYVTPTEVLADANTAGKSFRLGGMVKQGSVQRAEGSMQVRFIATDFEHELPVTYTGVLPDLFREGQGVIARGKIVDGTFLAEEVLAKHDEKYMPPEIAEKLKQEHGGALPVAKP